MTRRGAVGPLIGALAAGCAPFAPGLRPSDGRLAYGPHPEQTVSLSRGRPGGPVLVVLPAGDGREVPVGTRGLTDRGWTVAIVDRRVGPGPFPLHIADAARAVAWLLPRLDRAWSGAPARLGLLGAGEGGTAALMLARDRRYLTSVGVGLMPSATAALGAPELPDPSFTHPAAYGPAAAPVWRGGRDAAAEAIAFLARAL